jgi:DNA-binding HxlR family transcriptional regulator
MMSFLSRRGRTEGTDTAARTELPSEESPICRHFQAAADLIGRRWNPQIVRALQSGETRFTDLRRGIAGISDAVLSERLKELEAQGIVTRTVTPDTPVRIDYGLTERGLDLTKVMVELAEWAERWATA